MAGERRFTRIPPESSGDRIKMKHTAVVPFDQKDETHSWIIGGLYTIDGQSAATITAEVLGVEQGGDQYTGVLYVKYDTTNTYLNVDAEDDQNIKDPDGNIVAFVNGTPYAVYNNATQLVGNNNPEYAADVDRFGSLNTRFGEGAPEITAWGKVRQTDPRLLASWDFSKQIYSDQFANSTEGEGGVVWEPTIGAVKLFVNSVGDRSTNTSNLFAPVIPGTGTLYVMAARAGDAGSPSDGYVRFWGAFDATDGFFFALVGDALQLRHRYTIDSNNYSTTDHIVAQADWNKDTLDGSGGTSNPSGMTLDVTKINTYWVDFQWLGGGRVRYGVFYQGERVVCHEMYIENGQMNQNGSPAKHNAISNPNRPMCWAIAHPSGTGGVKEFYAYGGSVYLESDTNPLERAPIQSYKLNDYSLTATKDSGAEYAFTLRPELDLRVFDNYTINEPQIKENHTIYAPATLQVQPRPAPMEITDADVATNVLTVTTKDNHYMSLSADFEVWGTATVDGAYKVRSITNNRTFTADAPGIGNTTNETGELRRPSDYNSDNREVEVRAFAKCLLRGVSFANVPYTSVESDIYADHVAHGPEIARFVANDSTTDYEFGEYLNNVQYGAVYNSSDRGFARSSQALQGVSGDVDYYSVSVPRVVAQISPNSHRVYGTTIHYFDDKNQLIIRDLDGTEFDNTNYSTLSNTESTWMYMSVIDRDEAWLYNSIADIDDDRDVRVLQLNADPTGTIAIGGTVTLDAGGQTGIAKAIYVDGSNYFLGVERRSGANFDGYTGGINAGAFTVSVVTKSTDRIGGTGVWAGWDLDDERTTFDLDYETSLLAISSNGSGAGETTWVAGSNAIIAPNSINFYGPQPTQPAWTFMVRHLDKQKTNTNIRWVMNWKARTQ